MTIDEIKELIHVVHDTGIAELEVQRGENRVRIRSAASAQDFVHPAPAGQAAIPSVTVQPSSPTPSALQPAAAEPQPRKDSETDIVVKSPIVGTYYDAPAPGSPVFVRVGDRVEPKQVLCIIESMKLMNEIEAELSGTITAKLVENGRPVEYGESLFTIRPA